MPKFTKYNHQRNINLLKKNEHKFLLSKIFFSHCNNKEWFSEHKIRDFFEF